MTIYRRIYEQHFGPIPKDETGRTYDIHHIDGNRKNNHPSNLKAVSIQEHYNIHYSQGDYSAARIIATKMKKSHELISELASKANEKRKNENNHNFLDGEWQRTYVNKRVENGTHNFLGGDIQRKHHKKHLEAGTHHSQIFWKCEKCGKEGYGPGAYSRWHGDKCRS